MATLFVVIMRRWGDVESHAYPIGIYSTKELADQAGDYETAWRGGKYKKDVVPFELDEAFPPEIIDWYNKTKP